MAEEADTWLLDKVANETCDYQEEFQRCKKRLLDHIIDAMHARQGTWFASLMGELTKHARAGKTSFVFEMRVHSVAWLQIDPQNVCEGRRSAVLPTNKEVWDGLPSQLRPFMHSPCSIGIRLKGDDVHGNFLFQWTEACKLVGAARRKRKAEAAEASAEGEAEVKVKRER
jgi:hypothetical protein